MLNQKINADIEYLTKEALRYKAGELDEEEWRRIRLKNGVYGIRFQKDIQMLRVKIPFGELNSDQLRVMANIAEIFSTGIGHITTRQDIQFHWVALEAVPEALRRLGEVGLSTREACGNTVRNVTACPLAGVCNKEKFDVTPYAKHMAYYLLRNPLTQKLPRKFKLAFSGCNDDCVKGMINDIGAIATVKNKNGKKTNGFRLYVGGGLGSPPRAAHLLEEFTSVQDLKITCGSIIRIFDRFGNRNNIFRARMKFIIDQIGIREFRRYVFKERELLMSKKTVDPIMQIEDNNVLKNESISTKNISGDKEFKKWLKTNVEQQKQVGFYSVFVNLIGGDVTARQFRILADIAENYSDGLIRTTIRQNVVFRWIDQKNLNNIFGELNKSNLSVLGANTICDVLGCPGADTCNLGVTRSHRLAMKLSEHLLEHEKDIFSKEFEDANINISGCPNACAHNHIATIGLFGSAQRVNGQMTPFYQLQLGGAVTNGNVKFGEHSIRIPAKKVPEAISKLMSLYRSERQDNETFKSWINRLRLGSEEKVG